MQGKRILQQKLESTHERIAVVFLQKGLYLLKIQKEDKELIQQFIKR